MIGMAAVLVGTSLITFSYADSAGSRGNFPSGGFSQTESLPENFEKGFPNGDSNNQPPEFGSDSQSDSQQMPQPPEMPDSSDEQTQNNNSQSENQENSSSSSNTSVSNNNNAFPSQDKIPEMKKKSKVVPVLCYAFAAVQIAILLMILVYLIISKFNKKSFNQVFPEKKTE